MKYKLIIAGIIVLGSCGTPETYLRETQVTKDISRNHDLDNNDNFSPDGKWLVYDTRTNAGGIGACRSIERVNIETGETHVLFEIPEITQRNLVSNFRFHIIAAGYPHISGVISGRI